MKIFNYKKIFCSILVLCMMFTTLGALTAVADVESDSEFTDERTGIKIVFSSKGQIFPNSWYSGKINAKAISLDEKEYSRSANIIKKALKKYPVAVIKNNLRTIYVLKYIEFYNKSFGGTNTSTNVYLSNNGVENGYTDFYLEQLFHAEFSSILLRNNKEKFDSAKWLTNNPRGFEYLGSGVSALENNSDSEKFDKQINAKGFINQYAMSSLENDFNSFAKNLFLPKKDFHKLIANYRQIRNKRNIAIAFYNKLDTKTFTKSYFDQLTSYY